MITFAGTDIESVYSCKVFRIDTDTAPARDVEVLSVPGRSGDLLFDNGRYENVELTYTAVFYGTSNSQNADTRMNELKSFLASKIGYFRLEDTEHPYEYRMARVSGGIEPRLPEGRDMAKYVITFDAKPQRYLTSGETGITGTKTSSESVTITVSNPTLFTSLPLIRIYGAGQFSVGDKYVTISSHSSDYVDIDSEMKDCYCGATNLNNKVAFGNYKFPEFKPGNNSVVFASGITQYKITPRWWRI